MLNRLDDFRLEGMLNKLGLFTVDDFTKIPKFTVNNSVHQTLFYSVYCLITGQPHGSGIREDLRNCGFSDTDDLLSVLANNDNACLLLLGLLYYCQRFSETMYFHRELRRPKIMYLLQISLITSEMIKNKIFNTMQEIFYYFVVLLEELIDRNDIGYERIIKEKDELERENFLRRIHFL